MNVVNAMLRDQQLKLSNAKSYHFFDHSTLCDCTLEVAGSGDKYSLQASTFEACRFVAKKAVSHLRLTGVKLRACTFVGTFSDVMLGFHPEPEGDSDFGEVVDCDFTEARVSYCAFLGCDLKTLKLPAWPCFGILDQKDARQAVAKRPTLRALQPLFASEAYSTEVCTFHHFDTLRKEFEFDADRFRELLWKSEFAFIVG